MPKNVLAVVLLLLVGCAKNPDPTPTSAPVAPASVIAAATTTVAPQVRVLPPNLPPLDKGVILNLGAENAKTGQRPVVRVETNLPDGTALTIGIAEPDDYGRSYDAHFIVADGRVSTSPLWFNEGIPEGAYVITALMPIPETQPETVQSFIGPKGERLKGKLVHRGDIGVTVEASAPFVVGDDAKVATEKGRTRRDGVRKFLLDTLSTMRSIERRSRDATHELDPNCMKRFRLEMETLKELQTKLEGLALTVPGNGSLQAARSFLLGCSDCSDSESSRSQCNDAKKELDQAAADVAKAKIK